MNKLIANVLSIALIVNVSTIALGSGRKEPPQKSERQNFVPGEVLIKYKDNVSKYQRSSFRTLSRTTEIKSFKSVEIEHVKLPRGMTVEKAVQKYKNNPDIEYIEPNYYRYLMSTPNDTDFGSLWGLNNTGQLIQGVNGTVDADIDAPEAWDIATGSSDVVIAVIDSGIDYNHPDLSGNLWTNPGEIAGNSIDDDGNGKVDDIYGWDFAHNDNDPMDDCEHGTHVAGIIAAKGNNSTGITGVCWNAKIMSLKVLNAHGRYSSSAVIIAAILYADSKGADVINLSLGGIGYSQSEKDTIDASSAVVVCAAGNSSLDNDTNLSYPASYTSSNIISVAATDQNDNKAGFSNYGATTVDVAAPGSTINSAKPDRKTVWIDNFDDGTIADWTTGGINNTWNTTNSLSFSGSYSLTDSPGGNYLNDTNSWVITPVLNLSSYSGTKLEFKVRGSGELGYDFVYVQTSTNLSTWTNQNILFSDGIFEEVWPYFTGSTVGWYSATVDLGAYDRNSTVYVRFNAVSDYIVVADGLYIDDISVTTSDSSYTGTEYQYMEGTSMAAPYVSGLAALIKSHDPSMSNLEIKAAIEDTVDVKPDLVGKIVTGGRINAYNAIPPLAPTVLAATSISSSQIDLLWVDNAIYETGFKIERKKGTTGTYSEIGTAAANSTTYSDTGLSGLTTYYYRVRANRNYAKSRYTNETSVTTSAVPAPQGGSSSGSGSGSGGICFIATAAYGTPMAKEVKTLCRFRDEYLLKHNFGKVFVGTYYGISPPLARYIEDKELIRSFVRVILKPLVKACELTQ